MTKAFLSHGWCDATVVAKIAEALESQGIDVFLDKWDISHGKLIWATIDRAIDEASKLVVFLSRDALDGKGFKEEIDLGLQKAYERHGDVFIIPVALDPIEDMHPLLPVRIRAANMIRAFEIGFANTIDEIRNAIRGNSPTRVAANAPTDFYYRAFPISQFMIVELGTGLPVQEGFGFETNWAQPVKFIDAGMGPAGRPHNVAWSAGIWATAAGFHISSQPDRIVRPAYSNRSIKRNESFFILVEDSQQRCAAEPTLVRLYDQFFQPIREPVEKHP